MSSGRVLGVITARAGSKGIPGKNKRLFAGQPLLSWTCRAARDAELLTDVVVSSDDAEILALAEAEGIEALELPAELASDTAGSLEVLQHAAHKQNKQRSGATSEYGHRPTGRRRGQEAPLRGDKIVFKAPRRSTLLREHLRTHMTLVGDLVRAQARIKSLYRSRGVMVAGVNVYSPRHRERWHKQLCSSAQMRSTRLYDHLDFLLAPTLFNLQFSL